MSESSIGFFSDNTAGVKYRENVSEGDSSVDLNNLRLRYYIENLAFSSNSASVRMLGNPFATDLISMVYLDRISNPCCFQTEDDALVATDILLIARNVKQSSFDVTKLEQKRSLVRSKNCYYDNSETF